jgi:hypothetical protein
MALTRDKKRLVVSQSELNSCSLETKLIDMRRLREYSVL